MKNHIFLTILVSVLAFCPTVSGEEPDPTKLVRDLGSPQFAIREAAEQKLVALGPKAKSAVLAGTKDPDAEVARRCESILPKVRAAEREAFIAGTIDWPAPAGTHFRDLVGDTTEARKLFALMTENDRRAALADKAAADPASAAKVYAAEVARLNQAHLDAVAASIAQPAVADRRYLLREASRNAAPPEDVALALYLGTFPLPDRAANPADDYPPLTAGFADLVTGPQKGPARKLFTAWLDRRTDAPAVRCGLESALYAGIADALPVARRLAADPKAGGAVVGTAALVLGNLGDKEDLARLSALRADTRVYLQYKVAKGEDRQVQVRDIAAAMSLALRGQNFTSYAFQATQRYVYWEAAGQPRFMDLTPFQSAADREAALKKAWAWLDKQPDAPPKPGK
jgi:hypothetical protein